VWNCLVDNGKIDQKALVETLEAGQASLVLTSANRKDSFRGGNIKTVYCLPKGDFFQIFSGAMSITTSTKPNLRQTIGIDRTHAISEAERELEHLSKEQKDMSKQLADSAEESHRYKLQWNDLKKSTQNAHLKIEKLNEVIEQIREEGEAAENVTVDTTELEDDVRQTEEAYESLKSQQEEMTKALEAMLPGIQAVEAQVEEEHARNQKVAKEMEDAEKQLSAYMQGQAETARKLKKKQDSLQQAELGRQEQLEVVQAKERKRNDTLHKARLMTHKNKKEEEFKSRREEGAKDPQESQEENVDIDPEELESIEPILIRKEPEYYEKKIRRLQTEIERERTKRKLKESNPEDALKNYVKAKRDLDSKLYQLDVIKSNKDDLIKDLSERKKRWREFRSKLHVVWRTRQYPSDDI